MLIVRRVLIAVFVLAAAVFAWLWWTRPVKVDMAAYVPADSIVYFEAGSLKEITEAVTSTDDWRELAPPAGAQADAGRRGWLTDLLSFTGAGPSDAVVLARAQVAVAVLGFDAAEESDETLKYTPRAALVAETHTSEWRVKSAVEKLVGDFARRSLGASDFERKEVEGATVYVWSAPSGERKRIVAAVSESLAVVGNDEGAVRACLDVRRGARPSLASNEELEEMRARLRADTALAFGFAPQGSAAKVVEVFAPAFVGGISQKANVQSVLATVLPQLINQTIGSAGWSARVAGGRIEDDYFISLPGQMSERLRAPLAQGGAADFNSQPGAADFLPPDTHQFSLYNFRDPLTAWRGLDAALSAQVDVSRAMVITLALEALLKPYGIEQPREFLLACGPEVATARLEESSEGKVLVARVRDRAALDGQVRAYLGRSVLVERVGDADVLVSKDAERGAAAFVGDYLLLGSEEDVRRCVGAHVEGRTLKGAEAFKAAAQNFFDGPPLALTLTDDRDSVRSTLSYFTRRVGNQNAQTNQAALEEALARRAYSVSETRLTDGGFEKKTRSPFGLFGEVVTRFAPR
ncbi:MAG TPA: hypothetical protein VE713_18275 [Pyrinomonadaceae bacterium]|nr:hypothetical protein [Pyrinomonadaceae bacterium]